MVKFVLLLISMFAINAYAYPNQRYNDGRVIRSANPDPHHRIHSFSRDDYYGSRAYGSYDGYNRGGNYNGRLYPGQESYRYNGGLNPSSAAFAGAITSSGGSYAHAYTNAGSGGRFF